MEAAYATSNQKHSTKVQKIRKALKVKLQKHGQRQIKYYITSSLLYKLIGCHY